VIEDFSTPEEIKESSAIDSDPEHQHDVLRDEIYNNLPFFDESHIPAGKPDEVASDEMVSAIPVMRHLAKENRFVTRMHGNSMEPRIHDGDLILVDYSKEPLSGDTVIALVNGAAVVKKFMRQDEQIVLKATNQEYPDIEIKEIDQFQIAGVVLRIVEGAV
jgi:SOS-response transcriptional repressor LexA